MPNYTQKECRRGVLPHSSKVRECSLDSLIQLNSILTNPSIAQQKKLEKICLITAEMIDGADRVSLWTFEHDLTQIRSIICYDGPSGSFSSNAVLRKRDFAPYFDAILNQNVVTAPDAHRHPATACFTEAYFIPNNIVSLLDYVLHQDFQPKGVICCESIGKPTLWKKSDVDMLKKIAFACSLYFELT